MADDKCTPTLEEDKRLMDRVRAAGGFQYGRLMVVLRQLGIDYTKFNEANNRVLRHERRDMRH